MSVDDQVAASINRQVPSPSGEQGAAAQPRVAMIGLGRKGAMVARRLADSGMRLAVYDADQQALDAFDVEGVRRYRSPEAVAVDCDILIAALPNGRTVREVLRAALPAVGVLVIDLSSAEPGESRDLGIKLSESKVALIDATFTSGAEPAGDHGGELLVGGAAEDVERARPVLDVIAERVVHCGPLGAGVAMHALSGLLAAINMAAAIETLQVGKRFGLDPGLMIEQLNGSADHGGATSRQIAAQVLTGRFASGRTLANMIKQVGGALSLASNTATDVPLSRLAGEIWRFAEAGLEPGADHTALARWYEHRSGTRLRV